MSRGGTDRANTASGETWSALSAHVNQHWAQGVVSTDDSVDLALRTLSSRFDATGAAVLLCARSTPNDVLQGWRPVWYRSNRSPMVQAAIRPLIRVLRWAKAELPRTTEWCLEGPPHAYRVARSDYPRGSSHRLLAHATQCAHRLLVFSPVSEHACAVVLLDRANESHPFTADEHAAADVAAHLYQPVTKRWLRWMGVLNGQLLTPRERQVLVLLLQGHSEKAGAGLLSLKTSSFHQIVVSVYRKLGVGSRGELSALCLTDAAHSQEYTGSTVDLGSVL